MKLTLINEWPETPLEWEWFTAGITINFFNVVILGLFFNRWNISITILNFEFRLSWLK